MASGGTPGLHNVVGMARIAGQADVDLARQPARLAHGQADLLQGNDVGLGVHQLADQQMATGQPAVVPVVQVDGGRGEGEHGKAGSVGQWGSRSVGQ